MMRITQRLRLLTFTVLIGLLASVVLSHSLWAGQRWFPKAPLIEGFTGLPAPYDIIHLVGLMSLIIVALFSKHRMCIFLVVLCCVYLCIDDQNRLQPWLFNGVLMLVVLLFYKKRVDEPNNYTGVFISLQLLVTLVYLFSGLQKINTFFVQNTWVWLLHPLENILSEKQLMLLYRVGPAVPYLEMAIGLGLLIKPLRFIAIPLALLMHLCILLLIGPLGADYNHVVWPWNLAMMAFILLLFANVKPERFFDVSILFKEVYFYIVLTFMFVLPVFSLNNKYDAYLSSSLYSGNHHNATLILSTKAYHQLPYYIRAFVVTSGDYHILFIKQWAFTELNVPCVPEYRIFKRVQDAVIQLTQTDAKNVKMEFTEREKIVDVCD